MESRIKETGDLLINRKANMADVEKILKRSDEIEKNYQNWQDVRRVLSEMDAIGKEYNQLNLQRGEIKWKIQTEMARLEQEKISLEQKQEEIAAVQSAQPNNQKLFAEQKTRIEQIQSKLQTLERLDGELDGSKQKEADKIGENNQLKEKMKELKERMKHLENTHDADCPLCGQDLTEGHKREMLGKLNIEGKELGDLHRKNADEIKQHEGDILRVKKEIDKLKKLRPELTDLQSAAGILEQKISEGAKRVKEWQEKDALRLKEVRDRTDKVKDEGESKKELAVIEQKITGMKYSQEQHEKIRIEELNLRGVEGQFRELEQARTAQQGLRREIDTYGKQSEQLRGDLNNYVLTCEELQMKVNDRRSVLPAPDDLERELGDIKKDENKLRLQVGGAKQAVEVIKAQRRKKVQIEKTINAYNLQAARLKTLEAAFGKNGIPALLIEQSLPQIETQANEILDRLSNGDMSVSFETQREYRDKKREDKRETLDIIIRDGAGSREYELFSGGEAFRINFAIRLALSRVLAQRSGARLQTLVIDEGFGSQDADGRQRLVEAINLVNPDFEKILVITHLEELKDAFPSRIEVIKTASGSSVEVVA